MAWPWQRRRGALVASAARGSVDQAGAAARGQSWQDQAFYFYDALGEIHEAAQFAARPLSKLVLTVEEQDPETGEWADSENPDAHDLLGRINGASGDRGELLNAYGQLMFLAGECYLVGSLENDEESWEFLSTAELKPMRGQHGKYQRISYPGATPAELQEASEDDFEPLPNEVVVYRFWRRHPRFSLLADSPMRGVLDICAELEVLTKAVRGEALSRLARAGIMLIPEEASMPDLDSGPDEDPELDPLMAALMEASRLAIRDPGAASAQIPISVRTSGAQIPNWRHITFGNAANNYPEAKLRDEAINRLGIGLDMPVEALTGSGGLNHWTGWLLDDQGWRVHVQPLANLLVQNLTSALFRPELENQGIGDAAMFRINYDAASVVVNADRGKDAKDLHDRGAISDRALRDSGGFDDEDTPTLDNPNSNPSVIIALARAAGFGGPAQETGTPTNEPGGVPTERPATAPSTGSGPADVVPLPPNEGQPPAVAASASLDARIAGAAELAVERCRELAGSRIVSRAASHPTIAAQVRKVPKRLVACAIGPDAVADCAGDLVAGDLVAGGAETFRSTLVGWGVAEAEADALAMAVEAHAARTLFDAEATELPELLERGCAA